MGRKTFVGDDLPQQEAASFADLIYETADGFISLAVQSDREWAALTRALDRPEWLQDERFRTVALRQRNIDARLALTQAALHLRPASAWLDCLTSEGVPCAPVLTRTDMIRHEQVLENGIVTEVEHPAAGRLRQASPAGQFSGTPAAIARPTPGLGEHTAEALAELEALRAAGAFGRVEDAA